MKLQISVRWITISLALFVLLSMVGVASAYLGPTNLQSVRPDTPVKGPAYNDGFDTLPRGLQAASYSTLAMSGKVHPYKEEQPDQPTTWKSPFAPLLNVTWGPERDTSASPQGEPAAGIHPTNPLHAIVSGNFSIDTTTDGGNTWIHQDPPNPHSAGDVVNGWLEGGPGPVGANALEIALNLGGGYDYTCGRSTDYGVTWTIDGGCGATVSTPYFDDREYIWVDRNPASSFYGRVYVTSALLDAASSGSFNTVTLHRSTDNGSSFSPPGSNPIALVPNNEYALGIAHNEYPSLGISYNGNLGYVWRRGLCCGNNPTIGTNDKVMFARSTDGGVTFPFSTTIVSVPQDQSVSFNSISPLGVRWSDTPNIAADPSSASSGTFYAVWTQYRTAGVAASAAIYLSKTTDNGATWSTPTIPYNNPNADIFQGFGWVKVTGDHTVHLTFLSGTTSNSAAAQFYVQSTDGGATWSAPFQLNSATFGPFSVTTDYEANDVTYGGGAGAILATWAENHHFARIGTFLQGTPTPTVTGTPPSATPTSTATNTFTPTSTPTCNPAGTYRILIAYADTHAQPTMLRNELLAEPNVSAVDLFDAAAGTPTLAQLSQYNEVVAFGNNAWSYNTGMGDVLADYEDAGGVVVVTNFSFDTGGGWLLTGRWMTGGYAPFNTTSSHAFSNDSLGNYQVGHPLMQGVSALSALYREGVTMASGATQIAAYADTLPLVGVKTQNGHTAVAINAYLGYENQFSGDWGRLIVNAVRWLGPSVQCSTPTVGSATPPANTATRTPTNAPISTSTSVLTNTPTPPTPPATPTETATSPIITSTTGPTNIPTETTGPTNVPTDAPSSTSTGSPSTTQVIGVTDTPASTATACPLLFTDVGTGNPFYAFVRCLACRGIINGYPDGTFRPNNKVTRGQLAKILANAAGWLDIIPSTQQTFADMPPSDPFWVYAERSYVHGAISGYVGNGTTVNPCTGGVEMTGSRYFRPCNNATRGQIAKIDSVAAGYDDQIPPTQQTFEDVPNSNAFWVYVERISLHEIISGYTGDSTTVNPCTGGVEVTGLLYFRWCNNATRGQTAKIVANTFFPGCDTPNAVKP